MEQMLLIYWPTAVDAGLKFAYDLFIGLLALWIITKLPAWSAVPSGWWARRSLAARAKKLDKLQAELTRYQDLIGDPVRHQGYALWMVGRLVVWTSFTVLTAVVFVIVRMDDPTSCSATAPGLIAFAMTALVTARSSFVFSKLRNISDPPANVDRLEAAIEKLSR